MVEVLVGLGGQAKEISEADERTAQEFYGNWLREGRRSIVSRYSPDMRNRLDYLISSSEIETAITQQSMVDSRAKIEAERSPEQGVKPVSEFQKAIDFQSLTPQQQFQRTISETETPKPAPYAISAYEGGATPMQQTWLKSTGQAIGRIPSGFQMSARGLITEFDPSKGIGYIFEPYKYAGKQIGEEKITMIGRPQTGTIISEEYLPSEYKPFKGTKFEYAEMMEGIGYQPPEGIYERTGSRIQKYAPAVIETGALVGASFTPAGGAVVSGYIFGRGARQIVEAPTISGKALGVAGIGLGLYGMGATMSGLQRSITTGEISEAIAYKPQFKIGTRETLKGGIIKDLYSAKYQVGGTKVIKNVEVYSKLIKGKYFPMVGRGSVFARTSEYMTGKGITYMAGTKLEGFGIGLGGGTGGWSPSIAGGRVSKQVEAIVRSGKGQIYVNERFLPLKGKPFLGKKVKFFKETQEPFLAGGVSKQQKDIILSYGGKVKEVTPAWKTPSGIKINGGGFKFPIEEISLLKVVKKTPDVGFVQAYGRGSSQEFFKQLYAPPTQAVAGKLIQAPSMDVLSSMRPSTSILPLVSAGAKAVAPKTRLKTIIKPVAIDTTLPKQKEVFMQTSDLVQRFKQVSLPKIETIAMPKMKSLTRVIPITAQIPKQGLKQKQILKQMGITTTTPQPPSVSMIPTTPFIPFFPISLPPLGAGGRLGKRRVKIRRVVKYVPSYSAMIFKIFGKKPKGVETGLRVRPIPRGFSFAELFGAPKRKIIKKRKVKRR